MDQQKSWKIAERSVKLWFQRYMLHMEKLSKEEGRPIPLKYTKYLRMAKLSGKLARRMGPTSMLRVPPPEDQLIVTIDQTPNEPDPNTWTIMLEETDHKYKLDKEIPTKFASILKPEHQEIAENEMRILLSEVYASVPVVYNQLKAENPELMGNIMLYANPSVGRFAIGSPDFPNYPCETCLAVKIKGTA